MNVVTEFLKIFLKLFLPFLVAMLGAGHSIVEFSSLISHTPVLFFGFKYDPTLWTFLVTLFVTTTAISIAVKIILNIGKSYKKDR